MAVIKTIPLTDRMNLIFRWQYVNRSRQSVLQKWSEFKNSSAEANTFTAYPRDLSRLCRDSRTESSPSTTEMSGRFAIHIGLAVFQKQNLLHLGVGGSTAWAAVRGYNLSGRRIPNLSDIVTRSARESARILCMT
jgi:hypothetical protein